MRRSPAWIIGWLAAVWASAAQCQPSAPSTVFTGKSRFAIPFRSDADELRRLGAREVRLFVSVDAGANWQPVQTVAASSARFIVRAPKDGDYRFAVRTVDRDGRLQPEGKLSAELKVVVDTKRPTLSLRLRRLSDGNVQLRWQADDDHLDVGSLVLEYRWQGESSWRKLSVTSAAEGTISWDASQGGMLEARGRIADFAANAAVVRDRINIVGTSRSVPRPSIPNLDSDPIAGVIRTDSNGSGMPSRFPATDGQRTESGPSLHGFQAARQAAAPARNVSARRTRSDRRRPFEPEIVPQNVNPSSVGRRPATSSSRSDAQRVERRRPAIPRRVVNNKRFQLNYSVESVGRSGVEAVELFITVNDGGKWYRYGSDPDAKSPFPVSVPDDGTYGFAIRVRSGAGISDPPPQPGEKPSINVVVDQTPPKLELLPILQGRGSATDKFLIRWQTSDAHPAEKPVSLSYAESAQGPWKTISGWQSSQGSYLWTTTGDVPARVYVRISARDAAGNTTAVQTKRPIIVDISKPSARITNVDVSPN